MDFFAAESIGDPDDGARGDLEPVRGFLRVDRWIARPARGPCSLAFLPDPFDLESWPAVRESLAAGRVHCLAAGTAIPEQDRSRRGLGWAHRAVLLFLSLAAGPDRILRRCSAGIEPDAPAPRASAASRSCDRSGAGSAAPRGGVGASAIERPPHAARADRAGPERDSHDLNNILTASLGYERSLELDRPAIRAMRIRSCRRRTSRPRRSSASCCASVAAGRTASRPRPRGGDHLSLMHAPAGAQPRGRARLRPAEDPTPVRLDRAGFSRCARVSRRARAAVAGSHHARVRRGVHRQRWSGRGHELTPIPGLVGRLRRLTARDVLWDPRRRPAPGLPALLHDVGAGQGHRTRPAQHRGVREDGERWRAGGRRGRGGHLLPPLLPARGGSGHALIACSRPPAHRLLFGRPDRGDPMREWLFDVFRERPWWMSVVMVFSAYMAFVYMPWDLFVKPLRSTRRSGSRSASPVSGQGPRRAPLVRVRRAVCGFRRRRPWMTF